MSYGRFKFDSKNFFLGLGTMFIALLLPIISEPLINLITGIRDVLPWSKKSE